ncbi:MAG: hypothetical protein QG602_137 [Verrucomicrobiota bacterium]|nr:hypothetical protein [Verrucomicrobiota bacterium]
MKITASHQLMETFTVVAYILPDGGHYVKTVTAADATTAAVLMRKKLRLKLREFEVIGVIKGKVDFATVDRTRVALAPYTPASP